MAPESLDRCLHDGGTGVGAGHECRCVRPAGHELDSDRPHGCTCGALWADTAARPIALDVDHLRRIATAATPGPWEWRNEELMVPDPDDAWPDFPWTFVVTTCNGRPSVSGPDAAHIAAFDPPTVLELVDRLEEAQRAALTWKRRAEDAEEAIGRVVALADRWDAMTPNERAPVRLSAGVLREALGDYDADGDEGLSPGCDCTALCSMGSTCPGGILAGLSEGCTDEPSLLPPGEYVAHLGDGSQVAVILGEAIPAPSLWVPFVMVTAAQVAAAKAMVQRLESRGEPVPASVRKVAEAKPS